MPAPHGQDGAAAAPAPTSSSPRPGWYRLRAHARGRDAAFKDVREDPAENHLLLCRPAEQTPIRMIHATDRCDR
ncbi:hypothetical protein [Streptomyces pini]|nr:hypothetical protein [Streptomyces pini]